MKMVLNILILLLLSAHEVWLMSQQPVAKQVWREHCYRNRLALNDCNWCRCGTNMQYVCTARICTQVDMFGHFNDAIQNLDVGMEGHGVWRSKETPCKPGLHYQKNDVLCVCTAEGKWPNAVCRDIFQILHTVIPTHYIYPNKQSCTPGDLYQISCNICLCPASGQIEYKSCTKRNCTNDISETVQVTSNSNYGVEEVYAECERAKAYQIGCKTCVCLPNNRLLCDNCTSIGNLTKQVPLKENNNEESLCSNKTPGKFFKKDCNFCYCDKADILYCTVLKCLDNNNTTIILPPVEFVTVDPPMDDNDCAPGTKYKRDCNTCQCFKLNGIKYFACTLKQCKKGSAALSKRDGCVEGTKYEKNCLICLCVKHKRQLKEFCIFNEECKTEDKRSRTREDETSLDDLHGYCEPLHIYKQDCNKCRCLSDGKTVSCTSKICSLTIDQSKLLTVELIPFIQKRNVCPKGHRYRVDCNFCQCITKGNAICTTKTCIARS